MQKNTNQMIGARIKKLRTNKKLTQADLARELNYDSDTAIYLIEKGERGLPTSKFKKMAEILNTSTSFLLGEESQKGEIQALLRADEVDEKDIGTITDFIEFVKNQS